MWTRLLDGALSRLIETGTLHVRLPDNRLLSFGDGREPVISVALSDWTALRRLVLNPDLAVGEMYMEGRLTVEDDDLRGLLTLAIVNMARQPRQIWFQRIATLFRSARRRVSQFNPVGKARENVAHHYDLSGELYSLFLDADQQYSCAYFRDPSDTLEQAQSNKKHHIARKLLIEPGMKVLDIGCGWGGLALTLARDYGARVVGVTLSKEQHSVAVARVREAGLEDKIDIRLQDYRHVDEQFDRIVSVGMFEHVGVPHYDEYFSHVRDKLKEDGIALIHTIGRTTPPGMTNPWVLKYIFPGGYCPAMSETMQAVEHQNLVVTDVEVWRLHYAETLKHWYDRFMANIDRVRALYDDRFCRMWRYYLIASELTFRLNGQVVFQFQLSRDQQAVPLTRDYLYSDELSAHMRHAAE